MKKAFSLLLCATMLLPLLTACGKSGSDVYVPTGDALVGENETIVETLPDDPELDSLTLCYSPKWSMNPLDADNVINRVLFSLIYQGLFSTDSKGKSVPILCTGYRISEDRKTHTIILDSDATFSDGTKVTGNDVVATYEMAKQNTWYGGRFTHFVEITSTNDSSVTFVMDTPYENLAILLDIPILKAGEVMDAHPKGTGPFTFHLRDDGGAELVRVENWWCGDRSFFTNAQTINLIEAKTQSDTRDQFQFGDLALAAANPMSESYADYRCDYELWEVDNGILLYIGINVLYSDWFKDDTTHTLRKALTKAIDREYINNTYFNGKCLPTYLITSPNSIYYSESLASSFSYDPMGFVSDISKITMPKDNKNQVKKLKLLVNSDDSTRLRVARYLADELTELGIPTGVLEYGNTGKYTFTDILKAGTYDIYLGATRMSPNYDVTEFFKSGAKMSYGGIADGTIVAMMREALADRGNYYNLNKLIAEDCKIIPILYGTTCIFANRGQLLQLSPTRDNTFYYTIGKTMEGVKQYNG